MRKYSSLLVFFFSALIIQTQIIQPQVIEAQTFQNGQAARAVLGQTNFTAGNPNASQTILGGVGGLAYYGGVLYVADSNRVAAAPNNSRIVAFSTSQIPSLHSDLTTVGLTNTDCYLCGFPATFSLGQSTFAPPSGNTSCPANDVNLGISPCFYVNNGGAISQNGLANATGVATDGHYFAVADTDNNRVLVWNEIPTRMDQNADLVLGQTCFTCFATPPSGYVDKFTMRGPQGVWIQNNHLFVADTQDNRILIWNSIPTQNNQGPDVVLGQNDFNHVYQPGTTDPAPPTAANQLLNPISVSADATHLYVPDAGHNRVLIWNEIPSANAQNADVVIGQPDMTQTTANNINVCNGNFIGPLLGQCQFSLNYPRYVLSVNGGLFVADSGNDRVLIYSAIPTANAAAATGVLGEPDFLQDVVSSASISIASTAIDNTGGVDLLPTPQSLAWDGSNLYVSDPYNRRVVVFTPGDTVLPPNSVVNWASEIIRQEGIVQFSVPSGGTITAGDIVSITINGTTYSYPAVKTDTIDTIAQALVSRINAAPDPYVTAIFAGSGVVSGTSTVYLSSIATDLTYDSITLSAAPASGASANELATASGSYLSAGTAATGAIGMLVEINGTNLSDNTATATLDGVTVLLNKLGGVQVFMDGYACPILKTSPTQIVSQIPYPYGDRNSTSVYVRTVHNDGSVTVTNSVPVYIAPANPGIFNAPAYAGQVRPWPITQAFHQPGNPTAVIDFEGAPVLGNVASIVIGGVTYNYAVNATDVATGLLNTIVQNLVNLINATDQNVTASVGGAFNRVVLTAKQPGAAGNGITVTATGSTSSTNTAAGSVLLTAYSPSTCCVVTPNSPILDSNPAAPGELVTITGVGLGQITDPSGVAGNSLGTGVPYAGPVNNTVQSFVTATLGGTDAPVVNASLPTASYGTYTVQMIIPQGQATLAATTLNIAQNAFISNTVTMPVGSPVLYTPPAPPAPPPPTAPATTITELIESPSAGSTVSGTIVASGWALNSVSTLTGVTVSIDGQVQGSATRYSRPDVCAALSSPDCPITGWYLVIDTTRFADGLHTVAVTAASSNGADYTISQSFSILNNSSAAANPFHGLVEVPSANQTYRGVATFSGWSTYANSTISGVSIYVDGTPQGPATLYQRNDVCAVYPSPGCVGGWYFELNTELVANGSHTLVAKTVSSDGHTFATSKSFEVQNWTGGSSTTYANIEAPAAGAGAYSGTLAIGGWAGDLGASVTSIGVTVDGVTYGNAAYGFARTDVCNGNPLVNCPGVGFVAYLDTTQLADGQHTLAVIVNLAGLQSVTYSRIFSVGNEATAANPVIGSIDAPTSGATTSGTFQASGWAISTAPNDPVATVALRIDGIAFGNATYGAARPDVCAVEAGAVGCPAVGWYAQINTSRLGNGTHTFEITMTTGSGHRASTNTNFTVLNAASGPAIITVETPSGASSPFQGVALFSGWALNLHSRVSSLSITIDGVPYGSANYGLARADVCNAYPAGINCPNVGWTFGVDTTQLVDGMHTLGVTENNADGTYYTVSSSFQVANYSSGNPLAIVIDSPAGGSTLFGALTISGWALNANSSISSVNISIDGVPIGAATTGIARPDVCLAYPGTPGCPNVGWYYNFNTALLPNGTHMVEATAITTTGQSATVSQQFTIAN